MKYLIALLFLVASVTSLASEPLSAEVIRNDPGGIIGDFMKKYSRIRDSDERIKIDGYCWSACTLVTRYVPPDRICVTPKAVLGFHSAWNPEDGSFAADGTKLMWDLYPEWVHILLKKRGWNGKTDHPNLIRVKASKFYRLCS